MRVVETAGTGAGAVLAARVVETGRRWWALAAHVVLGWVLVLGAVSWRAGAPCSCPLLTVK